VNGDEILIQTNRALRCFSASGQPLWEITSQEWVGQADEVNGTPVVANIYKDATLYAIYADKSQAAGAQIYVINGQGVKVDSVSTNSSYFGSAGKTAAHAKTTAVADLVADDGGLEVITFSFDDDADVFTGPMYVRAYSIEEHDLIWQRSLGDAGFGQQDAANVAVGDIDRDGYAEVLVRVSRGGSLSDSLHCLRANGNSAWTVEGGTSLFQNYDVCLAGANEAPGNMEVLTTARSDFGGSIVRIDRVSAAGNKQTVVTEATSRQAVAVLSTADVDEDGETGLFMGRDSTLTRYESSGAVVAEFVSEVGEILIAPLLADVNGDGQSEVIVVHGGRNLYSDPESRIAIDVLTASMAFVARFEFPYRHDEVLGDYFGVPSFGGPAVGDIDGDGNAELAFVSLDSVLHVIEVGQMGAKNPWPQRYGNPMQTNVVSQPVKGTYNVPASLFNTVEVIDDVAFNGPTYVDGTATIRVADEDPTPPGSSTADDKHPYTEIIVRDEFRAVGSESQRIEFLSWDGAAESSNPWWSIFISDSTLTASGEFIHTEIRGALYGISAREPVTLRNCLIESTSG
jgi:hypothetical protein